MITLSDLTPRDTGRGVLYHPRGRSDGMERGVISSWNAEFIFVRYPSSSTSKACDPADLEWEHPAVAGGPAMCPDGGKCLRGCALRCARLSASSI